MTLKAKKTAKVKSTPTTNKNKWKTVLMILLISLPWIIFSILVFKNKEIISSFEIDKPLKYEAVIDKGPWGVLERSSKYIQPPINLVFDFEDLLKSSRYWKFPNLSLEEIKIIFKSSGLTDEVVNELIKNTQSLENQRGFVTKPPDKIILDLAPEIRTKLYPQIGKHKENPNFAEPFYFPDSNVDEWLVETNIDDEIKQKFKSLIYYRNNICLISDTHLLIPEKGFSDLPAKLTAILFRTKATTLKLVIKEGQDISKLIDYWSYPNNKNRVEKILTTASNTKGGAKVDILYLLPKIPQGDLNLYIRRKELDDRRRDCHWATFNFFNEKEDLRINTKSSLPIFDYLRETEISDPSKLKFGDIILFFNRSTDSIIHSCTYIADNIVYTKNGTNPDRPFLFTSLETVKNIYKLSNNFEIGYYTRKIYNTKEVDFN
jgi:hypothetical protein